MRLNGEIEWFLHESEWGACMKLSKAAPDKKLSVCLCKNVGDEWFVLFGAEASSEKIQNRIVCCKKEKPTTESVSRALFVLRIYNVHNILLQIEVETDEEDNVVVLDDDNNGDDELVDMVSVRVVQSLLAGNLPMAHVDKDAMKQEFCNLFHTIMEGYKMINEAYLKLWHAIEDIPLQIVGKILLDIYITASKQTMLAKDKPVGDSDDNDNDYDYSDSDDDDDQKEEEEQILIQKIKREPGALTSLTPMMIQTKTPPRQKKKTPPMTKTKTHDKDKTKTHDKDKTNKDKMTTTTMMTTDKDTDKAPRGKGKSKGYKGEGMVKRVGPEGLLEPM